MKNTKNTNKRSDRMLTELDVQTRHLVERHFVPVKRLEVFALTTENTWTENLGLLENKDSEGLLTAYSLCFEMENVETKRNTPSVRN